MRIDDWPEFEPSGGGDFASLTGVSVRRPASKRDKKSDITGVLASMRPTPEYLHAGPPADGFAMKDVTPPPTTDILAYWHALRAALSLPPRDALRASDVAGRWPNLILFRCAAPGSLQPDSAFATAIRANRSRGNGAGIASGVEMTAMLSQWILSAARDAASTAEPVRGTSSFDTPGGRVSYDLAALPFGTKAVDHVLCHIERSTT